MPAAYKGVGSQDQRSGNGTFTPGLPASFAAGDFAIAFAYGDSGLMAASAGWTAVSGSPFSGPGNEKVYLWYRWLLGGDVGPTITVTSTGGATHEYMGRVFTFSGVDTTTPFDAIGTSNSGTSATQTNGGVTTTHDALLVALTGIGVSTSRLTTGSFGGSTSGVSARLDSASATGDGACQQAYTKAQATPGASGSFSEQTNASGPYVSLTFALRSMQVTQAQPLAIPAWAQLTLAKGLAIAAVENVTLGALTCDRESRVSGTVTVPTGCTSLKVYRSTSSGGTYADITSNCVISGSAPTLTFVDKRPAYGSQAVSPGGTAHYKVAGVFGSAVGPVTSSASIITDTDREAGERALWARLHAVITPGAGYTTYLGSAYPGFYLGSAAYIAKTYSDLTTEALTDLDAWWTEVQTYINADYLFYDGTAPGYISTWRHARLIRDLMTACRELRFLTANATAQALAADITSVVNEMGKAALDTFTTLALSHQPVGSAGQVTLANVSAWASVHSYAPGAVVKPTSSPTRIYRMLSSDGSNKTSGASEPTWPTTTRGTVQDSGCIWQECTSDLPTWAAATAYTVGQVVRPTSTPPAAITRNATLSSGNALLTGLSTTSDLEVGMAVSGSLGVITAINSGTTVTVSVAPGVSGTFSLTFTPAPRTYRCTTAGTSHASSEPTWPRSNGGTVTDGTVTWTESTRTSNVPYDQYDATSPYAPQGSTSARISNSLTELAAAYALLYNDGSNSPDFNTGGSYRAAALAQINALLEVCLSQVAAMGGVEQQGVLVQYDSNYASQTMQGLAIITQSMGTGWSMYTEVRNAAGRIADWFDASFETEPTVSNAGQLDGWVQSAGYPQLAEFVWRQSGYQMLGRSQALGTRFVYSSALHPASAYSQAGQASGTQSVNSVHMLLEVAFADALGFPAFVTQGLAIAATLSVTKTQGLAVPAWQRNSTLVGLGVPAWLAGTKTVGMALVANAERSTAVGLAVVAEVEPTGFSMNMQMPPGTVVGAYLRSEWIGSEVPVRGTGSYPGPVVQEATVDAYGDVAFELQPGSYIAWAEDFPLLRRFFVVTSD